MLRLFVTILFVFVGITICLMFFSPALLALVKFGYALEGIAGMVLLVSPNFDGFDTLEDWEMIDWERCEECGEWYDVNEGCECQS